MYVCIFVCLYIVLPVYAGVCMPIVSFQRITLLLTRSPLFLLLLLLAVLLLFLVPVVAVATDDHVVAISAAVGHSDAVGSGFDGDS